MWGASYQMRMYGVHTGVLGPATALMAFAAGVLYETLSREEGASNVEHGGIVAAYLDEVLGGAVVRATGRPAVTGELTIRYVRPVPSGTPLLGRGRLVADHGRYVDVEGSLEELDGGRVVATARGRFFPVAPVPAGG